MSHKPTINKFLKSSSSTSSSFLSPDTHIRDTPDRPNSFLGRAVLNVKVEVAKDKDIKDIKDIKDLKVEEEFPVLGGRRPAATTTTEKKGLAEAGELRGACPLLYKTALLTKINHSQIEEQARIQKALRREMEAKEIRLKQMELSSMRERFVADAVHDCGSMAYDDDPDPKYGRRDNDDYDD